MKIIINENHFEKLEKMFDKYMEEYTNLTYNEREYYDSDWGEYIGYSFYDDIDEDYEDDEFVFKVFEPEDGDDWYLEYYGWKLKGVISMFGLSMFEKLLKPWFEKNYGFKIIDVKEV
jgi:hypothetical protein